MNLEPEDGLIWYVLFLSGITAVSIKGNAIDEYQIYEFGPNKLNTAPS